MLPVWNIYYLIHHWLTLIMKGCVDINMAPTTSGAKIWLTSLSFTSPLPSQFVLDRRLWQLILQILVRTSISRAFTETFKLFRALVHIRGGFSCSGFTTPQGLSQLIQLCQFFRIFLLHGIELSSDLLFFAPRWQWLIHSVKSKSPVTFPPATPTLIA